MTVTVKHSKTNAISDWTQAQLDEQIELGNFAPGTTLADIVLPSDWNNDHTLTGLGTMAEQDANNVAITGGTINGTTIGATTATTGRFTSVTTPSVTATTDNLTLSSVGSGSVYVNQGTNGATGLVLSNSAFAAASARLFFQNSNGTTSISNIGGNTIEFKTNATINSTSGIDQFRITHTASAVNYVQVTGSSTGNQAVISVQGSDTNVPLAIAAKGSGTINLQQTTALGRSATNWLSVNGSSASGNAVQANIFGADTNVSMAFQPKGTGAINLAAGSSGVNISNGGTVTAITRTATGSNYTSFPSVAITAPTTAGGVQAVITVAQMFANTATIQAGGTGYTVGNTVTIVGGTPATGAATYTISAVSGGVVTAVTPLNFGAYTALPTNPVSVTGGSGTGLTLNVTYGVQNFTISNAGSGYIEQPTVTFSGGGGSGAAAYATVGSFSTIKSLGVGQLITSGANVTNTGFAFFTPNTAIPSFLIREAGGGDAFLVAGPGIGGASLFALGGANSALFLGSNGTSRVSITTNGTSATEQLRVNHTTSAVNYVQVTGSTTTNRPTISAQGSDANISLGYDAKGTGGHTFRAGGNTQVLINNTSTAVNALNLTGSATGTAVPISVTGTDTNIDLALTPKGTGRLRFGTYTATVSTIAGYIEILDSGGTVRRLAVVS